MIRGLVSCIAAAVLLGFLAAVANAAYRYVMLLFT